MKRLSASISLYLAIHFWVSISPLGLVAIAQPELASQSWQVGDYWVGWQADPQRLQIYKQIIPGYRHLLWSSLAGQAFVQASLEPLQSHENRGSFQLGWPAAHCNQMHLSQAQLRSEPVAGLVFAGSLSNLKGEPVCDVPLQIEMQATPTALQVKLKIAGAQVLSWQGQQARSASAYGLGEQFSWVRLNGHRFPLIVQEAGIGRGAQPVSSLIDSFSKGSAGSGGSSYFPLPLFWNTEQQGLLLKQTEIAELDMRATDHWRLQQVGSEIELEFFHAPSPLETITLISQKMGRQTMLPDWIHRGAIVGMQGGTAAVRKVWQQLQAHQTPIAAFWLQDWVGKRKTAIGSQLWWNWQVKASHYPDWQGLRQDLEAQQIYLMGYINPFLVDVSSSVEARQKLPGQRNFYAEAQAQGHLVKQANGQIYPVQNTDFSAGLLDLSQPQTRQWAQQLIEAQLIQSAGFKGWMADYAEALPLEASIASPLGAASWHNRYPVAWAEVNAAAIKAACHDCVFFMRSGYSGSQAFTPLFWEGDQMVSWDAQDGLHSALIGLLSGGLSGIAVNHSDAGGYTSLGLPFIGGVTRSQELLFRWLEMNTFSAILRTHEGNQPASNAQIYDSDENLRFFARQAKIYAALFDYRKTLFQTASTKGWPVVRHPLLHYPDDRVLAGLDDQFMLGSELMIAPVLKPGQRQRRLYLPAGEWVHLWSGQIYAFRQGQWLSVPAALGQTPVFYLRGSKFGEKFSQDLKKIK